MYLTPAGIDSVLAYTHIFLHIYKVRPPYYIECFITHSLIDARFSAVNWELTSLVCCKCCILTKFETKFRLNRSYSLDLMRFMWFLSINFTSILRLIWAACYCNLLESITCSTSKYEEARAWFIAQKMGTTALKCNCCILIYMHWIFIANGGKLNAE